MVKFGMLMIGATLTLASVPALAEVVTGVATVSGPAQLALDGRTIHLDDIRMPGEGTKCAEWRGPKQVAFNCHEHARAALTSLVAGEQVSCVVEQGIGTCYARGRDIAELLVSAGWASSCGRTNRYVGLEEAARTARQGMWTGNFSLDTECPAAR
jgi:endonuclease YncB( thermonuclease family)